MSKLHIANTFFELELESGAALPKIFHAHPVFLQLQFLPLLYAAPGDALVSSDPVDVAMPSYVFEDVSFGPYDEVESWGASLAIASWAQARGLKYAMPPWDAVKEVNSKRFSFEHAPRLPGSTLLYTDADVKHWLDSIEGRKVLKTCFGVSGRGHLLVDGAKNLSSFLQTEWKKGLPVIAEPWKERLFDFSTQWTVGATIEYIGSTVCQNDDKGQYQFNIVGEEKALFQDHLPFLHEHLRIARPLLQRIAERGYAGNVGIDAMVYRENGALHLHPVVEINARKTMGYAALMYQRRHFPSALVRFSYTRADSGLLPSSLKDIRFQRNIAIKLC